MSSLVRTRAIAAIAPAFLLLASNVAQAQPPPAPAPATAPTASGDAAPASATEAEQHFRRGIKLFDDGDFKLALVEFERSYDLAPNFRVLYNIGEVQFQLNRYAPALRTLSRYLEVGGDRILPNRRAEVQRDLDSLKIRTAKLRVTVDVEGAEILVDGERIGRSPLADSELVDAGPHRIVVQKTGFVASNESITLAGADEKALDIRLVKVPERDDRRVIEVHEAPGLGPIWIGWGLTVALGIATVGTTIAWQNADGKLTDLKSSQSSSTERESQARTTDTLRTVTFVVGGATLLSAGVSLWLTLRHGSPPAPAAASAAKTSALSPRVGVGPGSLLFDTSF